MPTAPQPPPPLGAPEDDPDPKPAASGATAPAKPVSRWEATRFFVPLILTSELMVASQSIINAALAREQSPTQALAAFAIAFALSVAVGAAQQPMALVAISFLRDRRSLVQLTRFAFHLSGIGFVICLLTAFTPLGDWVFGGLLGAGPATVVDAKWAMAIFAVLKPISAQRNLSMGILMHFRHTEMITVGTFMRISALVTAALTLGWVLDGASVGAASMCAGISVETLYMIYVSRRYTRGLPAVEGRAPTQRELWGFSWPLMLNQSAEGSLPVIVNFFLGRLHHPELALASFGVVRGLVMLFSSPLRNLAQTAQALVRCREDVPVILGFAARATALMSALVLLLFFTPLRHSVLGGLMGLDAEMIRVSLAGLQLGVLVPVFYGLAATMRGVLGAARRTRALAYTAMVRFAMVILVMSLSLIYPGVNGAALGVCGLIAAYVAEAGLLIWPLRGHKGRAPLFPAAGTQ